MGVLTTLPYGPARLPGGLLDTNYWFRGSIYQRTFQRGPERTFEAIRRDCHCQRLYSLHRPDIPTSNLRGTSNAFINKYFDARPRKSYFSTDCSLVKAMFAFMIINLAAFVASTVVAFCLRLIELEHTMGWKTLPIFNKREEG